MEEILENKCVQVAVFRDKLVTSKQSMTFVEATYNNELGSGFDRDGTRNTKPDHWPGKNVLGVLMKKLQKRVLKENTATPVKSTINKNKTKINQISVP